MVAGKYVYGLGRRKSATARARLYKGKGNITINDKPALEYLSNNKNYLAEITDPLALVEKQNSYDITVRVAGGGRRRGERRAGPVRRRKAGTRSP